MAGREEFVRVVRVLGNLLGFSCIQKVLEAAARFCDGLLFGQWDFPPRPAPQSLLGARELVGVGG
ncbi:MAG: hypothetical protein ACODAD_12665, partial [Planctomycetota bacterium]